MQSVTLNNKETKKINYLDNYEEFLTSILEAFRLDENLKDKMIIKTKDGDKIESQDDFENLILGEFPHVFVSVDIPKNFSKFEETKDDDVPIPKKNYKHFEIISENKTYSIDIFIENENLLLKANLQSLKNEQYENSISLSQIQSNKYFKKCENINEAFLLLSELSNSKEKKIISNSNKEITIIFPINNVLINEVSFQLKFKEKNLEEKFNDLFNLVEKQQKEINNLKKEIEELKKRKK